ncbi:hypothetical protein P9112_006974 [Eukaryota sp. TZLM1-RC]
MSSTFTQQPPQGFKLHFFNKNTQASSSNGIIVAAVAIFAAVVVDLSNTKPVSHGSNLTSARKSLSEGLTMGCICFTHSVSLMLKCLLSVNWIKQLVSPSSVLVRVFKNHQKIAFWLRETGSTAIKSYPVTRFAFFILCLQRLVEIRSNLLAVVNSKRYCDKIISSKNVTKRQLLVEAQQIVQGVEMHINYWTDVEAFIIFTNPFLKILRISDKWYSGFGAFAHWTMDVARSFAKKSFFEFAIKNSAEEEVNHQVKELDKIVLHRIHYAIERNLFIIRMLNPALRSYNRDFFNDTDCMQIMFDFFHKFACQSTVLHSEFLIYSENYDYLEESESFPPHQWWFMFGAKIYPTLAALAVRLCGVTASASITERNWSAYDFQLTKRRLSLSEPVLDNIMSIYFNNPLLEQENVLLTMDCLSELLYKDHKATIEKMNLWADEKRVKMETFEHELIENEDSMELEGFSLREDVEDADKFIESVVVVDQLAMTNDNRKRLFDEDTSGLRTAKLVQKKKKT